jgi:hypothetical protein
MSHISNPSRLNTVPRPAHTSSSIGSSSSHRSVSPAASSSRGSSTSRRRRSSASKENEPVARPLMSDLKPSIPQIWRDGSLDSEEASELRKRPITSTRRTKSPSSSPSKPKSSGSSSGYNGLPTLASISDDQDPDIAVTDSPMSEKDFRPPPPAPSSAMGTEGRTVTRQRRSSSIKRKLSPGVRPAKVVDWEIPRKTLHSSIGKPFFFAKYNRLTR